MTVQEVITAWAAQTLGVPTEYGEFPACEGPCAMVKLSPGDPCVARYRSGGGVYQVGYEVYLRVPAVTEGERVEGLGALQALARDVSEGRGPQVDGAAAHELTSAASLYAETGGSYTVYQAVARVRYVVRTGRQAR